MKNFKSGLTGLALIFVTGLPVPLAAQEGERGWLGIRMQQRYECTWEAQEEWKHCTLVLNVREVQDEGPAATGGILAGDQLVAIDGEDVTVENWDRLVTSIRLRRPVSVDVMRSGTRHFARVIPQVPPPDPERLGWTGVSADVAVAPSVAPRVFVLMLTEPPGSDGVAVALTVRDTEDAGVAVEPSIVRIFDGQMQLRPLGDRAFGELPAIRREILGDLEQATESAYENATSAIQAVDQVRMRLSSAEFRRSMNRLAESALEEADFAVRFRRSFGGAEFEPVRAYEGRSGLLVLSVVRGTTASRIGLISGDLVVRAGDRLTREVEDLIAALEARGSAGVEVHWVRDGREMRRDWPGN